MQRKYLVLLVGAAALAVVGVMFLSGPDRPAESEAAVAQSAQPEVSAQGDVATEPDAATQAKMRDAMQSGSALKQIEALQIPSAMRKRMIVAYLASVVAPEPQPFAYWEPSAVREARDRLRAYDTDEATRRELRAEFGDSVKDDPEFAFLFRPYNDRYPGLDTDRQLELQRLSLVPARTLLESNVSPIQAQARMKAAQRDVDAQITKLLSPQEMQEYARKESSSARAVANGGFRFTQQEFDAVYPALAANTGDVAVRRFDPETTRSLRGTLGEARYLEFRKSQDPTFHMLSAIVASHGKAGSNVDAAYEAVYKNQEATAELLSSGPVLGFDAQKKKDRLSADLRVRLAANIGGDATDIFLRSMESNRGLIQTRMF